jgi:hypothetical protein
VSSQDYLSRNATNSRKHDGSADLADEMDLALDGYDVKATYKRCDRLVSCTVRFYYSLIRSSVLVMSIKPLTLWGHWGAPNPFKVCIVLEALDLPYETHLLELSEVKQESYVKLNPNGRLPTLQDTNTGLDLFEVSCSTTELRGGCDAKQNHSLAPSSNISLINTTRTMSSPTTMSSRSTVPSNGLLSKYQVSNGNGLQHT